GSRRGRARRISWRRSWRRTTSSSAISFKSSASRPSEHDRSRAFGNTCEEPDMSSPSHDYTARARLFGGNRMKLGVMVFNCSHGSTITTVPEAWQLNWPDSKEIAQAVDRSGMEALLPVGRWKGYGGPSNFNNRTFESFTWASAIGAVTNYCTVLATVHV